MNFLVKGFKTYWTMLWNFSFVFSFLIEKHSAEVAEHDPNLLRTVLIFMNRH